MNASLQESKSPPLWEIQIRVAELTSRETGIPLTQIKPASRLFEDLNIDSLELVELILALEEEFNVVFPETSGQEVFVQQPAAIGMLAEIVLHQWGTGKPVRTGWFERKSSKPAPPSVQTPFTQLGGHISEREWLECPLYEKMAASPEGYDQFRRSTDGMRCVLVPAAEIEIGSDAIDALPDQRPVHKVRVDTFLMDAEPVSSQAFSRFLNSVANVGDQTIYEWCGVADDDRRKQHFQLQHRRGKWLPLEAAKHQPMILVSWFGACAYSLWANRRDCRWYRTDETMADGLQRRPLKASAPVECAAFLPTEAQWEYAARGAEARLFPWGDAPATSALAHVALHTARATYTNQLPLADVTDKRGMSPFSLHHMAGNVWQWCSDWYAADFYQRPEACRPNPRNTQPGEVRSERGGSWIGPSELARSSYRRGRLPTARGRCLGFRCVGLLSDLLA